MAYDKLVDSSALDSTLEDIADAIRAKSGGSSQLAFPSGFISEIGNIITGGGGSGETLLASGVYTQASDTSPMEIPVSYSGNPKRILVYAPTQISGRAQAYLWATIVSSNDVMDELLPNGIYTIMAKQSNGNTVETINVNTRVRINNGNLRCSQFNASYPLLANTYNWYVWGVAE